MPESTGIGNNMHAVPIGACEVRVKDGEPRTGNRKHGVNLVSPHVGNLEPGTSSRLPSRVRAEPGFSPRQRNLNTRDRFRVEVEDDDAARVPRHAG